MKQPTSFNFAATNINNKQTVPQYNTNFGPIKESFTYFEPPISNLNNDQFRRESQQTHVSSQVG